MTAPKEISVLGLIYKIQYVCLEEVGQDKLGWCDTTGLMIYIVEDQPKSALANTFLHEVIHTINYSMGINSGDEENLTNRLANGLTAFFKDNPDAHKWWTSLLKDSTKRKATRRPAAKKKSSRKRVRSKK
tara:strand:- start:541 stop:930 length:390 start_codon:yes stop_codon:yes gene_type:complete